jgi:flavin-binding protein dodecin
MSKSILLILAILTISAAHGQSIEDAVDDTIASVDSKTIDDFDVAKVVDENPSTSKPEAVKDISIAIPKVKSAPIVEAPKEIIPPQSSVPVQASNTDEVKRILREHILDFQNCYQNALDNSTNPENFKGSLNLKFKINKLGKIEKSEISSTDFKSEKLQTCIKNILVGLKFPESGKAITVNQPINLNPVRK